MKAIALLALISTIGCSDPAAPATDRAFSVSDTVTSVAELRAAIRAGKTHILIARPLHFNSEADAVDLDELPQASGNLLVLEGNCDWGSGQLNRMASFARPLIYAGKSREWEFRIRCLLFDGWNHAGPAMQLGYAQLSLFDDVRIQRFGGRAPLSVGALGATSATEFRDVLLNHNEYPGEIHHASDVRWRGGASHSVWGGWDSGLTIRGTPAVLGYAVGGPVLVEDIHMEGGVLRIEDAQAVTFRGGFLFVAQIRIARSAPVHVECNGYFFAGGLWVDGVRRCANDQ